MSTDLVFDPPPPRRRPQGGGYLFPVFVCLVVAAAAAGGTLYAVKGDEWFRGRGAVIGAISGASEKDRDYFALFVARADLQAVLAMKQTWGREYARVAWLDEPGAYRGYSAFYDQIDRTSEELERAVLRLRQEFIAKHGTDSKEYTKSFMTAHPEASTVFDEIDQIVAGKCREQFAAVAGHLNNQADKAVADDGPGREPLKEQMAKHVAAYLPKQAPGFTGQVRAAARTAAGLQKLHARLG